METILIFLGFMSIFYGSLFCGKYLARSKRYIASLGEKIFNNKTSQYENSKFFSSLRRSIKHGNRLHGVLFILPLIALKSVVFFFFSILLITPILLIFQGFVMGSLFTFNKKQGKNNRDLAIITFWQLSSHISAATYGTLIGLEKFYNIFILSDSRSIILFNTNIWILTSIIAACLAAYFEVKSLLKDKANTSIE